MQKQQINKQIFGQMAQLELNVAEAMTNRPPDLFRKYI